MKPRVFSLSMLSGSMDDAVIVPFLDGLVEAGYEGICPHPRNGLKVPYPSRLYWQKLSRMIELAQERGLAIWHYDEFPYPSGQLGGLLIQDNPHMASQVLTFETITNRPNQDGYIDIGKGSLIALVRCQQGTKSTFEDIQEVTVDTGSLLDGWVMGEIDNMGYTATKRLHREEHERAFPTRMQRLYTPLEPLRKNETLIAIKAPYSRAGSGTKADRMPDLTRGEVSDYFLDHVYSQLSHISQKHHLINTPVFQDEVTFYSAMPWNEDIENTLRELWQDNFVAKLLALCYPTLSGWEWARFQYRNLCAELLEKNWYVNVREYCHKNNLRMAGHLPGEESISAHAQIMGNAYKNLSHFDIPGYDIISSTLPDDIDRSHATGIKLVQSVAWIEGRKPTMAEAFGANGFHQDLQRNRTVLAWLAAHDIYQVFDHATFSDSRGMVKYDAPPIHNRFNPMHKGAPDLWNWHHWFCELMEEYQFNPTTLVLFPYDALTRYTLWEKNWEAETTLLESFFHYLCMHSLDCVFVPSHLLSEVQQVENGFIFRGHRYENFVVPPVQSLHESTFSLLSSLKELPGFAWILPEDKEGISIFGKNNPKSTFVEVFANQTKQCNEEEMVDEGSNWFDDILHSPLQHITSPRSVMKSLRLNMQTGEKLVVLINPHDDELEVTASHLGKAISAPPEYNTLEIDTKNHAAKVLLSPRATAVFEYSKKQAEKARLSQTISPTSAKYRIVGENYWGIKTGTIKLDGQPQLTFVPDAISTLWPDLFLGNNSNNTFFKKDYNISELEKPLQLAATFDIDLDTQLSSLSVVLDKSSMPPGATWYWDKSPLAGITKDVFETNNTVFIIPPKLLTKGSHELAMDTAVTNGAEGILERPILRGNFAITQTVPLHLEQISQAWQTVKSTFPLWKEIGMPETFGPVDYVFEFELPDCNNAQLELPPCIGVAEIEVNENTLGRSNWEPRIVPIPKVLLEEGKNEISIRLYGSWNNIFSRLNRRENGLTEEPVIMVC